jgi:hypothetical protein
VTPRCTKAARVARVDIVYRLLLLGLDTSQIVKHIGRKYPSWGVKQRAIDGYIHDAKELLIRAGESERPTELGRSLARRHDLYSRAVQDKDYRTANAIQDKIDELLGLKAPQRLEVHEILSVVDSEIARKRREVEKLERQYELESAPDQGA